MSKIIVLSPFTIDPDNHSLSHGLAFEDDSLTVQSDAEDADINNIVARFGLTQELPYGVQVPVYDDFTNYPTDYHAAQNFIIEANNIFMEYPAHIRSRFDNDAGKFLDFVSNSENRDEAIKLGFIVNPPSAPAGDSPAGEKSDSTSDSASGTLTT